MTEDTETKGKQDDIPGWITTFADLMSLLLAFFVLLFSFSELDKAMYKQMAGSMRDAFGIQRTIKVREQPKGINIIAREFSPGRPTPTALNEIRQSTANELRQLAQSNKSEGEISPKPDLSNKSKYEISHMEADYRRLQDSLAQEIEKGFIELEIKDQKIIIRILEKGSFPSGSAQFIRSFANVLKKIGLSIKNTRGEIAVAGHTDNVPITSERFRSNWELSASRAVTVVHALIKDNVLSQEHFHVEGYAETRPIDTNDTPAGQSRNRRVEVTIVYGQDQEKLMSVKQPDQATMNRQHLNNAPPREGSVGISTTTPGDRSGVARDEVTPVGNLPGIKHRLPITGVSNEQERN
ncbi:MAG: MotB family protein [Thermodesulfobacteriota bacterium]|nr:MotB family protein [Thermodesulfobacteriota bacterium]